MGYMASKVTEIEAKGTMAPNGFITPDVALFNGTPSAIPILVYGSKHQWNPEEAGR